MDDFDQNEIPLNVRTILDKKGYSVIRKLGKGGTATVYLINSIKFQEEFVLKLIHNFKVSDITVNSVEEYRNEVETLKALNYQHIINIYDYSITEESVFLILEYCPNGSLADYLNLYGRIHSKSLIGLFDNILSTVSFIHSRKVAHSDIKPSNILIDKHGRIKLADFGLSHCYSSSAEGQFLCSKKIGSLTFMSPEMFNSDSFDPFSADIWALGVTFYILAVGNSPWPGNDIATIKKAMEVGNIQFNKSAGINVKGLINSMLTYNPKNRPSAAELLANSPIFQNIEHKCLYLQVPPNVPLMQTHSGNSQFSPINSGRSSNLSPTNLSPTSSMKNTNNLYGSGGNNLTSAQLLRKSIGSSVALVKKECNDNSVDNCECSWGSGESLTAERRKSQQSLICKTFVKSQMNLKLTTRRTSVVPTNTFGDL